MPADAKPSSAGEVVLVATDLSPAAAAALTEADALSEHRGAPLVVCHALPRQDAIRPLLPHLFSVTEQHAQLEAAGDAVAAQVREHTARAEDDFTISLDFGSPHVVIVQLAEQHDAGIIVVGSHDRGAIEKFLTQSTSDQVARHAAVPVLVHRDSGAGPVVAATDLSDFSVPAIASAAEEAERRGTSLVVVHAIEVASQLVKAFEATARLDDKALASARAAAEQLIATHLERVGCEGDIRVLIGGAVDSVLAVAEQMDASLVVVASRGHSALERFAIGSVAEAVVRNAPCSVLVVRH